MIACRPVVRYENPSTETGMSITTRKKNMRREKREVKMGERLIGRSLLYEFPFGKVPGTGF
jgi:hypothetical protein